MIDIDAEAAAAHRDRPAERRMLAERVAGIAAGQLLVDMSKST